MEMIETRLPTADWTQVVRPSLLYRLARLFGSNPDILSFAGGAPDPHLCPAVDLANAAHQTMSENKGALQYGRDLAALKRQIQALMAQRGVDCTEEQISITAGGQHGMDILTRLFLNPGGQVMLEELVYTGIQQTVMPFQPEILTIPNHSETGLDLDVLQEHLSGGARPAFLYTIPTAHNPVGVSLSREHRRRLVDLARRYQLPVIEDDAYGFLDYDEPHNTPLKALDPDWVIYLGTFSKVLAPGLRLGWIVSPASLTANILVIKQLSMLSVAPLSQHIVSTYLAAHDFAAHIAEIQRQYCVRRNAMLEAMQRHLPPQAQWTRPSGGLFVWVKLPPGIDTEELVFQAVEEDRVAYIPGKAFVTDPDNRNYDSYLRLSFARYGPELIEEGIVRLGRTLRKAVSGQPAHGVGEMHP
jgi:2-aminoadipate transaminase